MINGSDPTAFQIHPRLAKGGFHLGSLNNCEILLKNNAHYRWFIAVPRVEEHIIDVDQLTPEDWAGINHTTLQLSNLIKKNFSPDKINIGNIGNVVQQMHVHVIGRFTSDPAWPEVVWGHSEKSLYEKTVVKEIQDLYSQHFAQ